VALAALLALAAPAWSAITTAGDIGVGPVHQDIGPGNTLLPATAVWVGARWAGPTGVGSLLVDNGSFLQLAHLSFGVGGTGAFGTGLISGAGTTVQLLGDGASPQQVERLQVGNFGNAELTVSGGALLDTRGNQAPCLLAFHYCDSFVGSSAGDTASLNITGPGTHANLGQTLFVAQPGLAIQHLDGYTTGVPGGTTRGTVNVTAGAVLSTDRATVGPRHWSTNATGFERNFAEVNVSGAGSRWVVTGGQTVLNHATGQVGEGGAGILTANDSNAWAVLNVTNGGVIEIQGNDQVLNYINLTNGGTSRSGLAGGRTDMLVSGTGSQVLFSGPGGVLQVGRARGTANLLVTDGGSVDGVWYMAVGRDSANGTLTIDGADSWLRANGRATAVANQPGGTAQNAGIDIGRSGTGTVNVFNGGQLLVEASAFLQGGNSLQLGRDVASSGTLNISGAGSTVRLTGISTVPGGGAAETRNPFVTVGRDGNGTLNISAGGRLLLDGGAVSTTDNRRSTSLLIGGFSDQAVGGKGVATVTGAGSEIRLTSGDSFMAVGIGPTSNGQLSVRAGGAVHGMGLVLGRNGGVGVLSVDAGTLAMTGQQSAGLQSGAFFVVADGGGVGVATLANGSLLSLSNAGSSGAGFTIGGSSYAAGGDGSLTLTGGSRIQVNAAPGLAGATVGREGSGFLRLRGASSVDLGDGTLTIGRNSGGDGTVIVSEGSTITAGWVGVGARRTDTGNTDGGTGTFVLINSTLNAGQIVIGSNGFLGGTGTINGVVTNRGIFAPGNSPGRLEINGGFIAEAGSRLILEVEADGHGGFKTDELVFNAGQPLDLSALKVEFRFLGATNPNAFQASGLFATDSFFQLRDASGTLGGLAPALLASAQFQASSDTYTITSFSFDAQSGGHITAVPEPGTTALLLAGLASLGWLARRRHPARA
jgi:T5SS/PEP-CTERM-associated repeat protein